MKALIYLLLTALTFYAVAFVLPVPSLGPVPSTVVKSVLFVLVHLVTHTFVKGALKK
jgi:hypothetical protein